MLFNGARNAGPSSRYQVARKWLCHQQTACISAGGRGTTSPRSSQRSPLLRNIDTLDGGRQVDSTLGLKSGGAPEDVGAEKKMYILPMFPYPSGDLHMGHLRVYTISDVVARFRRMQGYNVLHPIGWDAFGLPAENAAIERGIDPREWTHTNISRMKSQLEAMQGHWDWNRELKTCDPSFYKHTQQLFLLLRRAGLAYQAVAEVNWDPIDKTVLANEQVDANGLSWRSGARVEKRKLKQWFLRITAFQESLLEDLDHLAKDDMWPEKVLAMQRNWLGKSEGAQISFPIIEGRPDWPAALKVFTTRPETLYGVQYIAIAATHPIATANAQSDPDLQTYLDTIKSEASVTSLDRGYLIKNTTVSNPLAQFEGCPTACNAPIPIFVAPYVLSDYAESAVMGVPGHDTRDHKFWLANRPFDPIRFVISPSPDLKLTASEGVPFLGSGYLTIENGKFAGSTSLEAAGSIQRMLESKQFSRAVETWRLRDWLISRQRYWGTPIPIIHCEQCGPVDVPDSDLPVELPLIKHDPQSSARFNTLSDAQEWVRVPCPSCGKSAKRDTDTMDTFVDSSWYFMKFPDSKNAEHILSNEGAQDFLPVDLYIGGVEHAILHLLYARFISKFLARTPLWPQGMICHTKGEPFKRVVTQGMVHGKTYRDPSNGRFLKPDEVNIADPLKPVIVSSGNPAIVTFEKMSKSKYNGVDPIQCISKYGADATRAHTLFQAPVSEVLNWDESKISGITRWLKRLNDYINKASRNWTTRLDVDSTDQRPAQYFLLNRPIYDAVAAGDLTSIIPLFEAEAGLSRRSASRKEMDNIVVMLRNHESVWEQVQQTIVKITESYSKTFALNTVISDLMALTNAIMEADRVDSLLRGALSRPWLLKQATEALIQMMAPVTPKFSQQCWERIHNVKSSRNSALSVFECSFPIPDGTLDLFKPRTRKCAIQVNGKLRCVIEIPLLARQLSSHALTKWIKNQVLSSNEAMSKLHNTDVAMAHKVIVVRDAKLVNFLVTYPMSGRA